MVLIDLSLKRVKSYLDNILEKSIFIFHLKVNNKKFDSIIFVFKLVGFSQALVQVLDVRFDADSKLIRFMSLGINYQIFELYLCSDFLISVLERSLEWNLIYSLSIFFDFPILLNQILILLENYLFILTWQMYD